MNKENERHDANRTQNNNLKFLLGFVGVSAAVFLIVMIKDIFLLFLSGVVEIKWLRSLIIYMLSFVVYISFVVLIGKCIGGLYNNWYDRNNMDDAGKKDMTFPKALKSLLILLILAASCILIIILPKETVWMSATAFAAIVFLLGPIGAYFLRFAVEIFMAWDNHDDQKARQAKKRKRWKPLEMRVSDLQKIFMLEEGFEIYINADGRVYRLRVSYDFIDNSGKKNLESFLWHIDDSEFLSAREMFSSPVLNGKTLNDYNTIHVIDIDGVDPRGFNIDRMYDNRIEM